jgi:hypothetical protein
MLDSLLLKECFQQSNQLNFYLGPEFGQADPQKDLEETMQFFIVHVDLLNRTHRTLWKKAGAGELPELKEVGDLLAKMIQSADTGGRELGKAIRDCTNPLAVERKADFEKATRVLRSLLESHQRTWPTEAPLSQEEAVEAYKRGETLEVTDAFAEMAGMCRDQWLQHVAAHNAKYHSKMDG